MATYSRTTRSQNAIPLRNPNSWQARVSFTRNFYVPTMSLCSTPFLIRTTACTHSLYHLILLSPTPLVSTKACT
jgi:hypothetical protein